MTAGTVVITGGIIAAVILLTIVTVLCYCRLQYYCCKRQESDGEEEDRPALRYSSSNQFLMTAEPYDPNGQAVHRRCSPAPPRRRVLSYTFCPSCSGYLPFYLHAQEELDNSGGVVSYRSMQQQELDLPVDMPNFNKFSLVQSVTTREELTHHSVSTDV
uniref:Family with sequence similarity 163 member B n=1 Tax=Electrophorus electricus TaxID=8005 RepID=A0A4W4HF66_ELEEL